ncbi:metal-sensing transcriptional repressor [Candidatus Wolfebacteria bacterium]|nr:metal-sensing transcriptional repressor [Candidatus Wolfebacteria bacterium]
MNHLNQSLKRRAVHRAKILEGQMKGLTKAIEAEEYCVNLLLRAISMQKSLKSLNHLLLENHLRTHALHQLKNPKESDKAIVELLKIYILSGK